VLSIWVELADIPSNAWHSIQCNAARRWHIVFIENGFDRALRNTGFTVDAFIGMNVDHIGILIKAITWANLHASLIFAAFARFSHDHRHIGDPRLE
jgi:hypothetical protein